MYMIFWDRVVVASLTPRSEKRTWNYSYAYSSSSRAGGNMEQSRGLETRLRHARSTDV